jgi:hypothetical protein
VFGSHYNIFYALVVVGWVGRIGLIGQIEQIGPIGGHDGDLFIRLANGFLK